MRILLVGDYPKDPRLGSAKVPCKLAEEFRNLGHHCDLLLGDDLGARPRNRYLRQLLAPLLAERAISRAFRRHGPYDVVDIAGGEGLVFGLRRRLGLYPNTVFISRSNGLEHLNYQRMLDDHAAGLLYKPRSRRLWYPAVRLTQVAGAARLCDKLLVLNRVDQDFAIRRGWKRKNDVAVIGHGVSTRFLEQSPPADAPRGGGILFCGTWTGVKGISYLVSAFTDLIDGGRRVNLTILGGAVPADVICAAFPDRAQTHLTVLDRAPEEEVMRQYRRHDVLVFCSTYEGFGMVVLEAMSQRLPVLATPVGCATTLIHHGVNGILVPARDSKALTRALRGLLDDCEMRRRLAENAFASVREMTWTRTALNTLAFYAGRLDDGHSLSVAAPADNSLRPRFGQPGDTQCRLAC